MKIVFVGNSVPLRVRPPEGKPYPSLIQEKFPSVECFNESKGATLITDGIRNIDGQILSKYPSIVIINYGINEAATRILFKKLDDWLYWRSKFYLSHTAKLISIFASFIRKGFNFLRPYLIKSLSLGGWSTPNYFEKALIFYVKEIHKETSATCILLTIPHVPEKVEKQIPGTNKRIGQFNEVMKRVAVKEELILIDVETLFNSQDKDYYMPEGIHYSKNGHEYIANELSFWIKKLIHSPKVKER